MFDQILHADWSTSQPKRMKAVAKKVDGQWQVTAPECVQSSAAFLDAAFRSADDGQRVLLGFDFPIGLPIAFAEQTGFSDFKAAIGRFGQGRWSGFFDVANAPGDVSLQRPFYPHTASKGVTKAHLVTGLGVPVFDALLRRCDRRTGNRPAACSIFWTVGANQVGKAAIAGWKEIVQPALRRGARLWPFDGTLADLSQSPGCVIAETYPGEAYHHVGIMFRPGESKRSQKDRASKAASILAWAIRNSVTLSEEAHAVVAAGFGSATTGEDAFDAFVGLLGMIEVVDGRRPEGPVDRIDVRSWEGWILGQTE